MVSALGLYPRRSRLDRDGGSSPSPPIMIVSEVIKVLSELDQGLPCIVAHEEYADAEDSCGYTVVRDVDGARVRTMNEIDWHNRGKKGDKEVVVIDAS